jgi:subtilisin family serine protease
MDAWGHDSMLKVAVIDTGLDLKDPRMSEHLCRTGHRNYVENETIKDINGHGTSIVSIIEQYADNSNYCIMVYKYYSEKDPYFMNTFHEIQAIAQALADGANIVNLSVSGPEFNEKEKLLMESKPHTAFIVAAGNDGKDLDKPGNEAYPASYFLHNELVVKSIDSSGANAVFSNYSKRIIAKENGVDVMSYLPNDKLGKMSGTSQATAIFTGKLICYVNKSCKK